MQCINIGFRGYKRLADTSCNTDGKMIAFLGPNEAGKSSLLQGLNWLSKGEALAPSLRNRTLPPDNEHAVVYARFSLSEEDKQALRDLPAVGEPSIFIVERWKDGSMRHRLQPSYTRITTPFDNALQSLNALHSDAGREVGAEDVQTHKRPEEYETWKRAANEALSDTESSWNPANDEECDALISWLREPFSDESSPTGVRQDFDGEECARLLEDARDILRRPHPNEEALEILAERQPGFSLFSNEDRDLKASYELSDDELRTSPPLALTNLLWIAELDLEELWVHISDGNTSQARTLERRANERLSRRLGSRWRQEDIEVQLNVSGLMLEVLIRENSHEGADTPFSERSDGLRMFVSLVAFLARHNFAVPPILLVDEAETHLHYDAQADLVEVLTNDVEASQVFYTTHSPGCLPRDLGTGIRLVSPSGERRDASELRNDFWTNSQPGFTPLLFAMGAGAAAFSAFRQAVLTEGAADMILLPSLLRLATNLKNLPYQVASGLANYQGSGLELEETAARVVYLLDGDKGGNGHKKRLIGMGIDEQRIFQFSDGKAPEDFVDPGCYLTVINGLLGPQLSGRSKKLTLQELDPSKTISKSVADWCNQRKLTVPSKPAVASALVGTPEALHLREGSEMELELIHKKLMHALEGRVPIEVAET